MELSFSLSINVKGRLLDFSVPQVMGILNLTPDSFYAGSRMQTDVEITNRVEQIIKEGASIIDVGAYSSRPNAVHITIEEEIRRLRRGLEIVNRNYPEAIISVDTFRAEVAEICVQDYGVAIINDVSGGEMDERMFETVARLNIPYIVTHIQGTPQNMQQKPHYTHLIKEVFMFFAKKVQQLRDLGVKDVILDPGFGFGKTKEHNYELLFHLEDFKMFELPILVGFSRKSMITNLLNITSQEALNGTAVLNTVSLLKGAHIIRVHDVKEAVEAVKIICKLMSCK
jgi:dihydropteroate synthase